MLQGVRLVRMGFHLHLVSTTAARVRVANTAFSRVMVMTALQYAGIVRRVPTATHLEAHNVKLRHQADTLIYRVPQNLFRV